MQPSNRVRTYLDPDAVGPLPRSCMADDSDELSAARTILRVPGTQTIEVSANDVIEVVDPNRPNSVAPVGYDTAIRLPRVRMGRYLLAGLAVSLGVLVLAAFESMPRAQSAADRAVAAAPAQQPTPAVAPVPVTPPAPTTVASGYTPVPASTIGTLRVDSATEGQRVFVDGVALSASAALVRCGMHDVGIGSPAHARPIDVPCGGEVTVYR